MGCNETLNALALSIALTSISMNSITGVSSLSDLDEDDDVTGDEGSENVVLSNDVVLSDVLSDVLVLFVVLVFEDLLLFCRM